MLSGDTVPDPAPARKARGAFFTPPELCDYVTRWAIRHPDDSVLEPSCGEAAFLLSAGRRLTALGADRAAMSTYLHGSEIHPQSARHAAELLQAAGLAGDIEVGDFFGRESNHAYDAVIGNPPYVRYQDFSGDPRTVSRAAALKAGVPLTALASSWAAFTVHAALFLREGGRLGLVLPAELLSVNYAAAVRGFLMANFAEINLVLFTERVFPEVQEEVVLLLADGYKRGSTDHCNLRQAHNIADLSEARHHQWRPNSPTDKWTASLLPFAAGDPYTALTTSDDFTTLNTWGETTLGMVTGNNKYFTMSPARATAHAIPARDLLRISPPGSKHLRSMTLTETRWRVLGEEGAATFLFRPKDDEVSDASRRYIAAGEAADIHQAYKCRVRRPWWRVPLTPPADLFLTYMNADTPRLCANPAGLHHVNSVHGIYINQGLRDLGKRFLPIATMNSVTITGAELVGRSYGGGMLKLEPKEADVLPVPSFELIRATAAQLTKARPHVLRLLNDRKLYEAVAVVDQILLADALGYPAGQVEALTAATRHLRDRRNARSGPSMTAP